MTTAADDYLTLLAETLLRLRDQGETLQGAGALVAQTLIDDGLVHVFGSGHSHMLAEELFYRAGGLGAVNPVLVDSLMLHANASLSTELERTPGLGTALFAGLQAVERDTLIVVTNSGANLVAIELATAARARGMAVIAIISRRHADSAGGRAGGATPLDALADVVLDNLGVPGDAAIAVPGLDRPMGPTSSVIGTAMVNAIALTAAGIAAQRGAPAAVFASSNVVGGDEANAGILDRYRGRVRSL